MKTWQNKVIEIECGTETLCLHTDEKRGAISLFVVGQEDHRFFLPIAYLDEIMVALGQLKDFLTVGKMRVV